MLEERQLRFGAVMAIVLLGIVLLLQYGKSDDGPADEDATAAIWTIDETKVTRVEIDRAAGGRVVFAKEGDRWSVLEPYQAGADGWKVDGLVGELADAKHGIPMKGDDPGAYGLGEPPVAKVTLTLDDGAAHTLLVGDKAPVGRKTYVKAADGTIAAVKGDLAELTHEAESFRDRHVVRFDLDRTTSVVVAGPEGTLDLRADGTEAGAEWWLQGFTRADANAVEDLLLSVLDLQFDRFADAGTPPVTDALYTITVGFEDGTTRALRFQADPTEHGILVDVDGGPSGYVTADALSFLGQGPRDVADPHAFPVDATAATRIEVVLGEATWALDKVGEAWHRDGKEEARGADAVEAVARASIDYRADPVPAITEAFGTVTVVEGDRTRIIDVGQREGSRWRIARDRAGGEPYLVPVAALDAIAGALDDPPPAGP